MGLRFLGGVILGILREVAVRARFSDRLDDALALDLLAMLQLFLELLETGGRDRNLIHLILFKAELKRGASLRTLRASSDSSLGLPQGRPALAVSGEIFLQGPHLQIAAHIGRDAFNRSNRSCQSGVVWHLMQEGCAAKRAGIGKRARTLARVEHQMYIAVLDRIDDVRAPLEDLVDAL